MGPKKTGKVVQAKGSEAEDLIEEYLVSQYKPFAINDIVQNLHNKVGKTAAVKALENLAAAGRITTKSFGKIVIYACPEQDLVLPPGVEAAQYTPEALIQWRTELSEVERDRAAAQDEFDRIMRDPPNEELQDLIKQNVQTVQQLQRELQELQENWEPQDEIVVERLIAAEARVDRETTQRSRMVKNLVSLVKDTVRPTNMTEFLVCRGRSPNAQPSRSLLTLQW